MHRRFVSQRSCLALISAIAATLGCGAARGDDVFWLGAGATDNLSEAANRSGSLDPGDIFNLDGNAALKYTVNIDLALTDLGIVFQDNNTPAPLPYTITGGPIVLSQGIKNFTPNTQTFLNEIRLGADQRFSGNSLFVDTLALQGGSRTLNNDLRWGQTLTIEEVLLNSQTFTLSGDGRTVIERISNGSGGGNGSVVRSGSGYATFVGESSFTGSFSIGDAPTGDGTPASPLANFGAAGLTRLDFRTATSPVQDVLYHGVTPGALLVSGTTIVVNGKDATANVQRFGNVSVLTGWTNLDLVPGGLGGSLAIQAGTISRSAVEAVGRTGLLNLNIPAGATFSTTSVNGPGGILNGFVTLNKRDWATVSAGFLQPYAAYTANNATFTGPQTINVKFEVDALVSVSTVINSLLFYKPNTGTPNPFTNTLTMHPTLGATYITSGGVMVAETVGAFDVRILQGFLIGQDLKALNIFQYNKLGRLLISSSIANYTGNAVALNIGGCGEVVLSGNNTYSGPTYVAGATVTITSNANLGAQAVGAALILQEATLKATGFVSLSNGLNNARKVSLSEWGTFETPAGSSLAIRGQVIGDCATLNKKGEGLLYLLAENSYGDTCIDEGAVELGGFGTTGSFGTGDVHNKGIIYLSHLNTRTLTNKISGPGSIQKYSINDLILDGRSNYTGETGIHEGRIIYGNTWHKIGLVTGPGVLEIAEDAELTSDGVRSTTHKVYGKHVIRPLKGNGSTSKVWDLKLGKLGIMGLMPEAASPALAPPPVFTATLDLTDSKYIVQASGGADKLSKIAELAAAIRSGSANAWTGTGITSSTVALNHTGSRSHVLTIALIDNGDTPARTLFGGLTVDGNSILMTHAILGDADISGIVDAADFDIWYRGVGQTTFSYARGDFDQSGIVDAADFDIWYRHVGVSGFSLGTEEGGPVSGLAAVPEPATLAVAALALPLLSRRRKNRTAVAL